MFTKISFERRMRTYITLILLLGGFLVVFSSMMHTAQHPAVNNNTSTHTDSSIMEPVNINPVNTVQLETITHPNVSQNDYDGKIVIATADEVITMQVIDGVKHFTNHLIG
jgi:hypothetical protein